MKFLPFDAYSELTKLKSGWLELFSTGQVNEGMRIENGRVVVDFKEDSEEDTVKLVQPKDISPVRKEKIPVYRGYSLEKIDKVNRKVFVETIKKWDAISQEDLKAVIDLTYPEELRKKNVTLLFVTGSSDPLSVKIAEALKDMYYPEARIVDILKSYYGVDVKDIVDWDKYAQADATTQQMIDTYLRGLNRRQEYQGWIKKSSGLESGARKLLKPGHQIDDYIANLINTAEAQWSEKYVRAVDVPPATKLAIRPTYLVVDEVILEGSTLRKIFKEFFRVLESKKIRNADLVKKSLFGYCLFSYRQT